MPSISDSIPFVPAYQPAGKHPIDNDVPRTNPLDKQAGEDAEVSNGKGGWKTHGSATRDHANRTRLDRNFLPSNKKIVDDSWVSSKGQYHRSGTRPVFPEDFHAPTKAPTKAPYHGSGTLPACPAPADNSFYISKTATEAPYHGPGTLPAFQEPAYDPFDDLQVPTKAPTKAPCHGSGTLPAFPAPADNPFYISKTAPEAPYHGTGTLPAFPEPAYDPFDDLQVPTKGPYPGSGTLPACPAPADNPFYFLATATEVWHPNSRTQPPSPPSDYKALDDSPSNDHREPIDFEIKPDGNGGWTKG